jgi:hypothetical protein
VKEGTRAVPRFTAGHFICSEGLGATRNAAAEVGGGRDSSTMRGLYL